MRNSLSLLFALALAGCSSSQAAESAKPDVGEPPTSLSSAADRGTQPGGDVHFTGDTTVAMLFVPNGPRTFSGAEVTFQPGARTAWHSHPAGQTLVVTGGNGWVQIEGGPRHEVSDGDVVWTPPGVRHWHGAKPDAAMTHTALQGTVADKVVDWGEKVSDSEYLGKD